MKKISTVSSHAANRRRGFTLIELLVVIAIIPQLMSRSLGINYYVAQFFGGTSLLIIVVVTMDFRSQVMNYIMSHQYESLLRKANFKAGGIFPAR